MSQVLAAGLRDQPQLRVAFEHHQGRWHHRLEVSDGELAFVWLRSREGDTSEVWPPSPALQQLLMEDRGDAGTVAMLLGMAGPTHWSLSIEPRRDRPAFLLDVACRLSGTPAFLGSSYSTQAPLERSGPARHLKTQRGKFELSVTLLGSGTLQSNSSGWELQAELPDRYPATARWQYELALSAG